VIGLGTSNSISFVRYAGQRDHLVCVFNFTPSCSYTISLPTGRAYRNLLTDSGYGGDAAMSHLQTVAEHAQAIHHHRKFRHSRRHPATLRHRTRPPTA
jgi:hypothetical protein